ncbi:DUF2948 family protein [Brevundimonas subvibrioides]|uniref:DUF2948 family protein n=1 Tax=Brevundimonas subvibrioides TaxID=74313 RepID=UPI0022B30CFC|nr:DUF2948 family protein [Brevundimonas subvibrioides]
MTTEPLTAEEDEAIRAAGGNNAPLRLLAEDDQDLAIISAALQDSILRPADIVWEKGARRLTIELSRFCWECGGTRVRAAMQFGDVQAVKSRGLPRLPDAPLELLAIHFIEGEAPSGKVILMFAGGGDLRVDVECLDAVVADLSERWQASVTPTHLDGSAE